MSKQSFKPGESRNDRVSWIYTDYSELNCEDFYFETIIADTVITWHNEILTQLKKKSFFYLSFY